MNDSDIAAWIAHNPSRFRRVPQWQRAIAGRLDVTQPHPESDRDREKLRRINRMAQERARKRA